MGWGGVGTTLEPRTGLEPRPNSGPTRLARSGRRCPSVLPPVRPPPPPARPALGGSPAPPRPAPSGQAPPPVACGRANVEGDGKGHDRTWTAGVCARVGVSGLAPSSGPWDSVPLLLSSPARCSWAAEGAGGGGAGRGPAPGGRAAAVLVTAGGHPSPSRPAQAWYSDVTTAGLEGRGGSA